MLHRPAVLADGAGVSLLFLTLFASMSPQPICLRQ